MIKKSKIEEYTKTKKSVGIAAIKLNKNDSIAKVIFMNEEELLLITKKGMSIRFETNNIAPIGRVAAGVKSIKLKDNDEILTGIPVNNNSIIGIFTNNGYGRKVKIDEFPIQGRVGKGVMLLKADEELELISAIEITDKDNLLVMGKPNSICISASDIPITNRLALGNKMVNGSEVQTVAKI